MVRQIDRREVQKMRGEGAQLVEVLSANEFEAEHLPSAINIPLKTFSRDTMRQLDPGRPVIVYCYDYQ